MKIPEGKLLTYKLSATVLSYRIKQTKFSLKRLVESETMIAYRQTGSGAEQSLPMNLCVRVYTLRVLISRYFKDTGKLTHNPIPTLSNSY